MVTGSSFVRRVLAALIVGASSSAALAQTEAPHPFYGNPKFISTLNLATSTQFFPLPTNYNALFLNCTGVLMSAASNGFDVFVGEGTGTPTWETGAHYTDVNTELTQGSSTVSVNSSGTANSGIASIAASTTVTGSLRLSIDNVASSSITKTAIYASGSLYGGDSLWRTKSGTSYWNNDTNAITGLEFVPFGNFGAFASGTCSLYGMN